MANILWMGTLISLPTIVVVIGAGVRLGSSPRQRVVNMLCGLVAVVAILYLAVTVAPGLKESSNTLILVLLVSPGAAAVGVALAVLSRRLLFKQQPAAGRADR